MQRQVFRFKPRELLSQAKQYAERERIGKKPRLRQGIYLLPNFFTTAGLFAGFYAVVAAMNGFYDIAAIAIFIAMITDTMDGRVARLTRTQSAFGAEYDSLSDMVAFGVAPALVMYSGSLHHLGKVGWLTAFVYTASGALRLARFNTQLAVQDKRYFQGLPIPAGAGIIASSMWIAVSYGLRGMVYSTLAAIITLTVACLMVSNIRYYSFKEIDFKNTVPFVAVIAMMLVFVGIAFAPPEMLFIIFIGYGLSGPVMQIIRPSLIP